jgi:hypothetical protein
VFPFELAATSVLKPHRHTSDLAAWITEGRMAFGFGDGFAERIEVGPGQADSGDRFARRRRVPGRLARRRGRPRAAGRHRSRAAARERRRRQRGPEHLDRGCDLERGPDLERRCERLGGVECDLAARPGTARARRLGHRRARLSHRARSAPAPGGRARPRTVPRTVPGARPLARASAHARAGAQARPVTRSRPGPTAGPRRHAARAAAPAPTRARPLALPREARQGLGPLEVARGPDLRRDTFRVHSPSASSSSSRGERGTCLRSSRPAH